MDTFIQKHCDERHNTINRRLDEHGREIDELQQSNAVNVTKIENLTNAISSQTKAIWGLVCTVIATLGGFFIWYIQTLN